MSLMAIVGSVRPDEIYNLAAQSHVQVSFDVPEYTADVVATGVLRDAGGGASGGGLTDTWPGISGVHFRALRKGGGSTAEREDPLPSLQPLRCGKTVRLLDRERVPGSI